MLTAPVNLSEPVYGKGHNVPNVVYSKLVHVFVNGIHIESVISLLEVCKSHNPLTTDARVSQLKKLKSFGGKFGKTKCWNKN